MRQYERNGVHVDQCTECRGIFLDRGELEHLVDAEKAWAGQAAASPAPSAPAPPPQQYQQPQYQQQYQQGYQGKPYKKKKSFLEELFD
jgi:Zn-finger nucleic acid-binding protein